MPIADLDGVYLNHELGGAAGPVLVLVNSLGSNLHMWDKILPFVEKDHRVLRYDSRGHGLSGVPPLPYTIERLGRDLLGLLDKLQLEYVSLCGLSLGGVVSMWLGIHAPQRVDRLVLANTAARIGTHELWEQRIDLVRSQGMGALSQLTLGRWFTEKYRQEHPGEMEQIRSMIEQTPVEGYLGCCGVLRDTDLRPQLGRLSVASLIITGRHDPATPAADGRFLHEAVHNSDYVELDCSHLSAWERPYEFAKAVLAFLNKGERANG